MEEGASGSLSVQMEEVASSSPSAQMKEGGGLPVQYKWRLGPLASPSRRRKRGAGRERREELGRCVRGGEQPLLLPLLQGERASSRLARERWVSGRRTGGARRASGRRGGGGEGAGAAGREGAAGLGGKRIRMGVRDGSKKETLAPYLYDDCYRTDMGCLLGHYFKRRAS